MWRLAAARTTGTHHAKTGAPCQDRYSHHTEGDAVIIAVSDGAGSAECSQIGAQIAVERAVELLTEHLSDPDAAWDSLVFRAAMAARHFVIGESATTGRAVRDYACTLLLIVLVGSRGAAIQIGDGLIAYRDDDSWAHVFSPQKGQYANQTRFLTDETAEDNFLIALFQQDFRELAVMTDGLEDLAFHFASSTVHEPFLEALMRPLRLDPVVGLSPRISTALANLLESDRIASRTSDDLTIVLATRAEI